MAISHFFTPPPFEQTYDPGMAVQVIEHWWNGCWGRMNRRVIKLRLTEEDHWEVYVLADWGREWWLDFRGDEQGARDQVELLLTEYGPWRNIT
jgi:hypothetical protein